MQNFGVTNKEHYGMLWYFWSGQWRKWQNWRKIASRWRFELDAKSGPLEAVYFGKIGDFGKNRNACNGENGETGEKSPSSGDLNWMPKVAPSK